MTIASILKDKGHAVVTIGPDAAVAEAVALLARHRIGALPVLDDERVAGIVSERDVLYGLAEHGAAALDRRVADAMTAPVVSVAPGESVIGALALMTRRRIRHLPVVVDDGALVGVVSIGDLVKSRIDRIEAEAAAMRSYITGT
jgi:CBS domain-containing protein